MHIATVSRYPINKTILLSIPAKKSSDNVMVAWNMLINIFSKTSITEDEAAVNWENCKACWDLCSSELAFCGTLLRLNLEGKRCVSERVLSHSARLVRQSSNSLTLRNRSGHPAVGFCCTRNELITTLSMQFLQSYVIRFLSAARHQAWWKGQCLSPLLHIPIPKQNSLNEFNNHKNN